MTIITMRNFRRFRTMWMVGQFTFYIYMWARYRKRNVDDDDRKLKRANAKTLRDIHDAEVKLIEWQAAMEGE